MHLNTLGRTIFFRITMYFCIIVVSVILEVFFIPYTKVEESFNIQAIHDILHFGTNLSSYDHFLFPGVVPRTFIGPLLVSMSAYPLHLANEYMEYSGLNSLYISRLCLAAINLIALFFFTRQVTHLFSAQVSKYFCLLTLSQFHFLFYISRPLPNTFAMIFVLITYYFFLKQNLPAFIWTSAFVILVFRSELAILLGLFLLMKLISKNISLTTVIVHGFLALVVWVALTTCIDSFFWQKWNWPEGGVFYFNVVLNKSAEWGTMPFHAYFTKLLPKALGPAVLLMIPCSMFLDTRFRRLAIPCLGFVLVYSVLPHKELRFVIYVVPMLNLVAARAWSFCSNNFAKGFRYKVMSLSILCMVLANCSAKWIMLKCSYENYPGGVALEKFHKYVAPSAEVNLHMDNLACQTGAVRFGQVNSNWVYNKTENLKPGSLETLQFTHLLVDMSTEYQVYKSTHTVLFTVRGYSKVEIVQKWPFIEIVTKPQILALQHKNYDYGSGKFILKKAWDATIC